MCVHAGGRGAPRNALQVERKNSRPRKGWEPRRRKERRRACCKTATGSGNGARGRARKREKLRARGGTWKAERSGSGACGIACSATLILCGDREPGRVVDACGSEYRDVGGVQGCGWWKITKARPGCVPRRSSTSQRGNEARGRRCGPITACAVVGDGATSGAAPARR